ncbi:protein PilT [Salinisphaera sp. PC39]|uniref:type II toxin-antitoxin system VapC family toxin n=1 Tax=Salinisphaera sp. PC39 TaxID=1304156 RepID=UPI003340613D
MILLDTHAWIWWVADPDRLSAPAAEVLARAREQGGPVYLSSISVWEVAMLVDKGRLELTMDVEDWVAHSEAVPWIECVPVTNHLALRSVRLPDGLHPDPADRLIVATARYLGVPLVTRDRKLQDYPHVQTLW